MEPVTPPKPPEGLREEDSVDSSSNKHGTPSDQQADYSSGCDSEVEKSLPSGAAYIICLSEESEVCRALLHNTLEQQTHDDVYLQIGENAFVDRFSTDADQLSLKDVLKGRHYVEIIANTTNRGASIKFGYNPKGSRDTGRTADEFADEFGQSIDGNVKELKIVFNASYSGAASAPHKGNGISFIRLFSDALLNSLKPESALSCVIVEGRSGMVELYAENTVSAPKSRRNYSQGYERQQIETPTPPPSIRHLKVHSQYSQKKKSFLQEENIDPTANPRLKIDVVKKQVIPLMQSPLPGSLCQAIELPRLGMDQELLKIDVERFWNPRTSRSDAHEEERQWLRRRVSVEVLRLSYYSETYQYQHGKLIDAVTKHLNMCKGEAEAIVEKVKNLTLRLTPGQREMLLKFRAMVKKRFKTFVREQLQIRTEERKMMAELQAQSHDSDFDKERFEIDIVFLQPDTFISHVQKRQARGKEFRDSPYPSLSRDEMQTVRQLLLVELDSFTTNKTFAEIRKFYNEQQRVLSNYILEYKCHICEEILNSKFKELGQLSKVNKEIDQFDKAERRLERIIQIGDESRNLDQKIRSNQKKYWENKRKKERLQGQFIRRKQQELSERKGDSQITISNPQTRESLIAGGIELLDDYFRLKEEYNKKQQSKQRKRRFEEKILHVIDSNQFKITDQKWKKLRFCEELEQNMKRFRQISDRQSEIGRRWFASTVHFKECKQLVDKVLNEVSTQWLERSFMDIVTKMKDLLCQLENRLHYYTFGKNRAKSFFFNQNNITKTLKARFPNMKVQELERFSKGICKGLTLMYSIIQTEHIEDRSNYPASSFENLQFFHLILTSLKSENVFEFWENILSRHSKAKVEKYLKKYESARKSYESNTSNNANRGRFRTAKEDFQKEIVGKQNIEILTAQYQKSYKRHIAIIEAEDSQKRVIKCILDMQDNEGNTGRLAPEFGDLKFPLNLSEIDMGKLLEKMDVGKLYLVYLEEFDNYSVTDGHVVIIWKLSFNTFNYFDSNTGEYMGLLYKEAVTQMKQSGLSQVGRQIICIEPTTETDDEMKHFAEAMKNFSICFHRLSKLVSYDDRLVPLGVENSNSTGTFYDPEFMNNLVQTQSRDPKYRNVVVQMQNDRSCKLGAERIYCKDPKNSQLTFNSRYYNDKSIQWCEASGKVQFGKVCNVSPEQTLVIVIVGHGRQGQHEYTIGSQNSKQIKHRISELIQGKRAHGLVVKLVGCHSADDRMAWDLAHSLEEFAKILTITTPQRAEIVAYNAPMYVDTNGKLFYINKNMLRVTSELIEFETIRPKVRLRQVNGQVVVFNDEAEEQKEKLSEPQDEPKSPIRSSERKLEPTGELFRIEKPFKTREDSRFEEANHQKKCKRETLDNNNSDKKQSDTKRA